MTSGFQVVVNIFTSIGYFATEFENRAAFSELARIIGPGGILVLDVINPAYLRANFVADTQRRTADGSVSERRELEAGNVARAQTYCDPARQGGAGNPGIGTALYAG